MAWELFAKPEREDPDAKYVITYTDRPPLKTAGKKRKTLVQGAAAKNATCAAIREAHGQVLRVDKRRW